MRAWRWSAAILVLLGAGAAPTACASSGSNASAGCDGGVCSGPNEAGGCKGGCWHPNAADEEFAEQFCSIVANCCVRMQEPSVPLPTAADQKSECRATVLRLGLSRDAALRTACLSEVLRAASLTACMPEIWPPNPSVACSRLIAEVGGPVPVGGSCQGTGDCASSPGTLSYCGTAFVADRLAHCYQDSPGKEGDRCNVTLDDVGFDYVIASEFDGHFCSHLAGLVCGPIESSTSGHFCERLRPSGSACTVDYQCASDRCSNASGDYRCALPLEPHDLPDGSSCSDNMNCASQHCRQGACVAAAQASAFGLLCSG